MSKDMANMIIQKAKELEKEDIYTWFRKRYIFSSDLDWKLGLKQQLKQAVESFVGRMEPLMWKIQKVHFCQDGTFGSQYIEKDIKYYYFRNTPGRTLPIIRWGEVVWEHEKNDTVDKTNLDKAYFSLNNLNSSITNEPDQNCPSKYIVPLTSDQYVNCYSAELHELLDYARSLNLLPILSHVSSFRMPTFGFSILHWFDKHNILKDYDD